jgi:hypothetical protein
VGVSAIDRDRFHKAADRHRARDRSRSEPLDDLQHVPGLGRQQLLAELQRDMALRPAAIGDAENGHHHEA